MTREFRINNSGLRDWQTCKRLYYYRQILNLEPNHKPMLFVRGHFYHGFVEARFNSLFKFENIWDWFRNESKRLSSNPKLEIDDKKELEDILFTAELVLKEWCKEKDAITPVDPHAIEMFIEHEIGKVEDISIVFEGKIDAYGKVIDCFDQLGVYELKSKNTDKLDHISERFRPQAILYASILRRYDIDIKTIVREHIFCPKMTKPKLNKNGQMSRAKITCTWDYYKKCLIENNLRPEEYEEEMKPKLRFLPRSISRTRLTRRMVQIFEDIFIYEAKAILKEKEFPRSWGFHCNRCHFKDPCFMGIMDERDEEAVLRNTYKQRKSHYDQEND